LLVLVAFIEIHESVNLVGGSRGTSNNCVGEQNRNYLLRLFLLSYTGALLHKSASESSSLSTRTWAMLRCAKWIDVLLVTRHHSSSCCQSMRPMRCTFFLA